MSQAAPKGTITPGWTLKMLDRNTRTPVHRLIAEQLLSAPVALMKKANFSTKAWVVPSLFTCVNAICLRIKSDSAALIIPQANASAPKMLFQGKEAEKRPRVS